MNSLSKSLLLYILLIFLLQQRRSYFLFFEAIRQNWTLTDYMWYVAEIWHEREHTNLNGRMLLLFCWLFAILVPLGTPLMFRYFSWIVAFAIVMILCFLPDLFCQLRYTAGRREALREYYGKMKHPGRKLAKIVLIAIALTVVNVALMFHLGFICWV